MQRDFHYDVIYVLAQMAGFDPEESYVIAYSSQYVDDANNSGIITFSNGIQYSRISSAHEAWDTLNNLIKPAENPFVWVPFHFLPGNSGLLSGQGSTLDYYNRLICLPNSNVAKEMVLECLRQNTKNKPFRLHRLGITLHTYADTWTHQGFLGLRNALNRIDALSYIDPISKKQKREVLNETVPALGHGQALTYPDLPYLYSWEYKYEDDRPCNQRNNVELFVEAADFIYKVLLLFKGNVVPVDIDSMFSSTVGLSDQQKEHFRRTFTNFTGTLKNRHDDWVKEINSSSFEGVTWYKEYYAKGEGSWKHEALGTTIEIDLPGIKYQYNDEFLTSNWKYFHDALQIHRAYVLHELLPQYNICAI